MIIEKYVGLSLWLGCLCVHLPFPLPFCLFLRLTTYLPTFPSYYLLVFHTSMFIQSSIRLSACLSDCLCVLLPFHLPFLFSLSLPFTTIYLSLCLSACFAGCLYICLPFPFPAYFFSDCLLSIYPSMFACSQQREKAQTAVSMYISSEVLPELQKKGHEFVTMLRRDGTWSPTLNHYNHSYPASRDHWVSRA